MRKANNNLLKEYAVTHEHGLPQRYTYPHVYSISKRIFDIIIAIIGLVFSFPILVLFCLAIKVESKGPALYFQERVGRDGEYFKIIKLRSMSIDAESKGAQWAVVNDPRVTKIGSFIRKTRIDEIPQLLNVLQGDMSIIGPRPERPMFTAQFNEEIPGFVKRLAVKPGVTGWAQVNGGYDITPKEKLKLDLYYIDNRTIAIDIKILFKTVKTVVTGNGAR